MKIISPNNYFAKLFFRNFEKGVKDNIHFTPSSLIISELLKSEISVALIPVTDLIRNKDFYISRSFGLSFEGALSNSYIYYSKKSKNVSEVNLSGDVSSCEVILSKLLFKELYDADIEIILKIGSVFEEDKNFIITGDMNFKDDLFIRGFSFSEEVVELINLPYVNYVFASKNPELLKEFNSLAAVAVNKFMENSEEAIKEIIPPNIQEYFTANISSLIFNFNEQDMEGIEQVLRLPYFHGLITDILTLNLV
jgi:predicted solute-binding protein